MPVEIFRKKNKPTSSEEFIERRRGGCLDKTVQTLTFKRFGVETVRTHSAVISFPGRDIKEDNLWVVRLANGKYVPRDSWTAKVTSRKIVKNR